MTRVRTILLGSLILLALGVHIAAVWMNAWKPLQHSPHGRDFASYYYAVQVAWDGESPYATERLTRAAQGEKTRKGKVHPYFYPPPFMLGMIWTLVFDLFTSYALWFWLDELAVLAAALALWRWWRPLGPAVPLFIAWGVALCTAIPNNHLMGQVNLPVLALVLGGLWSDHRGRSVLGGGLIGTACMLKMSPALFVAWWLLHRRWKAAGAACGIAVLWTVLSALAFGVDVQTHFYFDVLPGFGSGNYNGLLVPISLFGNHSIPNLMHQVWPGSTGELSGLARGLSLLTALMLVGVTAWGCRTDVRDLETRAAQVSAVALVMLLIPVYTYEHHLVWALPAVVITGVGIVSGRLKMGWWLPVGFAWAVWAFSLAQLKSLWLVWRKAPGWEMPALAVQELKTAALLILWLACLRLLYVRRRSLGSDALS